MSRRFDTILFDLDGTLTDSSLGITTSIQYALAKMGVAVPDRAALTDYIGPPLHESFQAHLGCDAATALQAVAWYREYYGERGIYENMLYAGVPELLAMLHAQGRVLGIATSKVTVYAAEIARHFSINTYFTQIVGSNLDGTRTDKGEVIAAALATLPQATPSRTVMIGDRKHDIWGAQAHGLASIGVTYGFGSLAELQMAQATFVVDSVAELTTFFEE